MTSTDDTCSSSAPHASDSTSASKATPSPEMTHLPATETAGELLPATIDLEAGSVERSVFIRADRQAVWSALTTPDLMSLWFGDSAVFDDLEVGTRGTLGWAEHGEVPMEIVRADEPDVFAFRWGDPGEELSETNSTVATFTLQSEPGGTRLTVVETGFDLLHHDEARRRRSMEDNRDGWNEELDELVAFLELQDSW